MLLLAAKMTPWNARISSSWRWGITARRMGTTTPSPCGIGEDQHQAAPILLDTAMRILDAIRKVPRWESSLLSQFPAAIVFHPQCAGHVITSSAAGNPLLSLRFFNWLIAADDRLSVDSLRHCFTVLLNALADARAWKPALLAIRLMKCLPDASFLDSFLHRLFLDPSAIDITLAAASDFADYLSVTTWNAALSAALRARRTDLLSQIYHLMTFRSTVIPNSDTLGCLVRALCRDGKLFDAYSLIREANSVKGILPDVATITEVVAAFSRQGNFSMVSELLHFMIAGGRLPDIMTYQTIIHGLCKNGMINEAFRLFCDLKSRGYFPDTIVYTTVIDGLCKTGRMDDAMETWQEMISKGMLPNDYTYNSVVDGYCKLGDLEKAKEAYREMLRRGYRESTVSCNTMIAGFCLHGKIGEALELFKEMSLKGIQCDVITYNTVIQGLCRDGRINDAMELHNELLAGLEPSVSSYTPLIQSLCKQGKVGEAIALMKDMEGRSLEPLVCTNDYIILGFCETGEMGEGMDWFAKMLNHNLKPMLGTCNRLVECLTSADMVDDALLVVKSMFQFGYHPLNGSACTFLLNRLCRSKRSHSLDFLEQILLNR